MPGFKVVWILRCLVWPFVVVAQAAATAPQIVTIVVDDDYPPYSYLENRQLKGVYIELLQQAAVLLAPEYKLRLQPEPWRRALASIEQGQVFAIMPPYQNTLERPYIQPYSVPLFTEEVVAICAEHIDFDALLQHKKQLTLQPLQLGINAGYLILNPQLQQAAQQGLVQIWENKSTDINILKLLRGRLDCYLNDRQSTLWVLQQQRLRQPKLPFRPLREAMLVMRRSAHIGYSADPTGKFAYKQHFIAKMDQALLQILQQQPIRLPVVELSGLQQPIPERQRDKTQ